MFEQILAFLLGAATSLFSLACLARLWMQWVRAPFANPVGQAVIVITGWAVTPLRRIVPSLAGIDLASALAAWLAQLLHLGIVGLLSDVAVFAANSLPLLAWAALLATTRLFIDLLIGIVIVAALLSWIAPSAPAAPLFDRLAAPLLRPVRRFIPTLGGLDFAPLIVILLLQAALIVLENLH